MSTTDAPPSKKAIPSLTAGAGDSARADPPVVLQVLPALVSGGVERGAVEVAEALGEHGARALVASSGGPMIHDLRRVGGTHVEMPLQTKGLLGIRKNGDRLARLVKHEGVHIIHARSRAPAWSALSAARRTGTPFVTTFHGTYGGGNPLKKWYNSVMTRGDRVIAISEFIADHIRETYKVSDDRLRIIPRGVDLRRFDPEVTHPPRIIELVNKWRVPDGVPIILLPGRLTRWKGQSVLIDALAQLEMREVRCLLVGADQGRVAYRAQLESRIRKRGLEGVVHLVDECRDMPAAYKLADVVVSASTDPEAFGRVVAEAQAMGKPVIAPDHGGAREILGAAGSAAISKPDTGWLVPPGDPRALAETLQIALSLDSEAREKLASRAIARIRAHYSLDRMCAATMQVYEELLCDR